MRLKAYAVCHQVRRVKDGFMCYDSTECLTLNELNYEKLYESTLAVTKSAREYVAKYDKTILVGHTSKDEKEALNMK